jgi:hypothetical protein
VNRRILLERLFSYCYYDLFLETKVISNRFKGRDFPPISLEIELIIIIGDSQKYNGEQNENIN